MTINGEKWRIYLVSFNHPALYRTDGSWALGACDDELKSIFVYEGLTGRKLRKVLCHEIAHAAMFSYNVELSLDEEELFADIIATYGCEIIRDTDQIFKSLKR